MAKFRRRKPTPQTPLQEGNFALRGCLWALLGAAFSGGIFTVLLLWGGIVGHAILAAVGLGVAGLFFPLFSGTEPHSANQERFMLYFSLVTAICGMGLGVWLVVSGGEPPWWVFALAGLAIVVFGGWVTHWWHQRK